MKTASCILITMALASIIAFFSLHHTSVRTFAQSPAQEATPALEGLDPVMLTKGKEVQGDLKISVIRGRFQYLFANQENKAIFQKDPARYEIQLDGHCARMGPPVGSNPDLFTVHEDRIYVFGSGECKKLFEAAPEKYLEPESGASKAVAAPESLKKGRELIEKAVAAMGGASNIDSLASYREKSTALQTRRQGDVEVKTDLTIVFPDRIRLDMEMPEYRDPSIIGRQGIVIVPGDSFILTHRGPLPLPGAYRDVELQGISRKPLSILRARKSVNIHPAARGNNKVGETTIEDVAVEFDGVRYTLGIDPATGRILNLSYRRRGPQGNFGQFVQVFSDFRTVDGLNLPFKITSTFDGELWKEQSPTVTAIVINGKVDPALYEKP